MEVLVVAAALVVIGMGSAHAAEAATNAASAARLSASYADLKVELGNNQFHRPLHMSSQEGSNGLSGEVFALVDSPFPAAGEALDKASQWCEILTLHLNIKYCRPSTDVRGEILDVSIGRKYDQPVDAAYRVAFSFRVVARSADYLQVRLAADEGPLGTSDYRIVLEATPEDGRTFIRMSYSYSYGVVGWLAMETYLNTLGRGKVGFTVVGNTPDGLPRYIEGMRGVVERNTMRYYLAIDAFVGALSTPAAARREKSLSDWFAGVERYPRQLHEMERGPYLEMKRREHAR